jgi:FkbM family methyltransferase
VAYHAVSVAVNLKQFPIYNELRYIYPLRLEMRQLTTSRAKRRRVWAIATLMLVKHWLPRRWRESPVKLLTDDWGAVWVTDRSEYRVAHEIFVRDIYEVPGLPERAGTILDLGANIGLAARYFAVRYPDARIVCYEADPLTAVRAQRNIEHLPNVEMRVGAITGKSGSSILHRDSRESWATGEFADGEAFETDAVALQEVLAEFQSVDILKLDIEGSEYEAVENCDNISHVGVIIGELHNIGQHSTDEFWEKLRGFQMVDQDLEYGNCTFVAARR